MSSNKKQIRQNFKRITAPEYCSLIDTPELSILFFNKVTAAYQGQNDVEYDLSKIASITESFAAVMTAHIKDWNISQGRASTIIQPQDDFCKKKLKRLGIQKKVPDSSENIFDSDINAPQKITNLKVANQVAKAVVDTSTALIYGQKRKIKELYAILIELMANTNNHADSVSREVYPWWLWIFHDPELDVVKFVFLDLGVGIFESLPVKQHILQNPIPFDPTNKVINRRGVELSLIFQNLEQGKIKSSTGKSERGKGIPLVADSAKSGHFSRFIILSNDAYIDMSDNTVSVMHQHFSGTLYYFELTENKYG
jgi:hypothetical protein